jgi:hypothetical protein
VIWLGIALIIFTFTDILLKLNKYFFLAIILGALGAIPIQQAYKTLTFSSLAIYWSSGMLLTALVVGHWYFKESITGLKLLGAICALLAIYLADR